MATENETVMRNGTDFAQNSARICELGQASRTHCMEDARRHASHGTFQTLLLAGRMRENVKGSCY